MVGDPVELPQRSGPDGLSRGARQLRGGESMRRAIVIVMINLMVLAFLITAANFVAVSYDQIHQYARV
jgi:hypothetical protein